MSYKNESSPRNAPLLWRKISSCTVISNGFVNKFAEMERDPAVTDEQFAYAVHDGKAWVCVGRALESDELKPIPGFTRDSIYRDSMREHGEWMERATALMRDMHALLGETCDEYYANDYHALGERLREFGIEEEP